MGKLSDRIKAKRELQEKEKREFYDTVHNWAEETFCDDMEFTEIMTFPFLLESFVAIRLKNKTSLVVSFGDLGIYILGPMFTRTPTGIFINESNSGEKIIDLLVEIA